MSGGRHRLGYLFYKYYRSGSVGDYVSAWSKITHPDDSDRGEHLPIMERKPASLSQPSVIDFPTHPLLSHVSRRICYPLTSKRPPPPLCLSVAGIYDGAVGLR